MRREKSHFQEKEPALEKILARWRREKVIKHIPQDSKVLDLGCGYNGKLLQKISGKISSGVGVDLAVNPKFSNEKIRLIEHDLNKNLLFPDSEFDAVVSLANLEHLENPGRNIREIHRVLKPRGILLLTAPSVFGKPVLKFLAFINLVSKQEIIDHKNYFDKKTLLEYCEKTGFSSCKHKYFQLGMNNFLRAKK